MVAAFTLDSLRYVKTRGPTRLMMRPMIAIKVKPSSRQRPEAPALDLSISSAPCSKLSSRRRMPRGLILNLFIMFGSYSSGDCLSYNLADRHESGHDRDDQAADNDADEDDGGGTGNTDQPVQAALELSFVKLRNALREHGQLTG